MNKVKGLSEESIMRLKKAGKKCGKKLRIKNTFENGVPCITISFEKVNK
jgi:hypothetical protein